ncbi:MAG: glycosyltransferase [Candidatus Sulfotelmatobacter sp.]
MTVGADASGNHQEPEGNWDGIICFANDWYADPLSKKHIMLCFARSRRILWINSVNNRRPRMAGKDFRRVFQKLTEFRRGLVQVQEGIWVLTPLYIPFHGNSMIRKLNRSLLGAQIRHALAKLKIKRAITYTFAPTSADVAGSLGEKAIVYHCVDEFSAFSDAGAEVAARERELLSKADVVLCSAAGLYESKKAHNRHTYLVTHGVDYEFFRKATCAKTSVAPELQRLPKPILGFTGLLADWVDLALLADLAKRRPEWSIVLIGRCDVDLKILDGLRNVHLLGHRPYDRLPEFLRGFDIALLPFVNNELTVNANPLKLREYLAAGLPVIASPIPEVARYKGLVALARTAEEYEREIDAILKTGDTGPSAARSERMASESWDAKVMEIEALLRKTNNFSSGG